MEDANVSDTVSSFNNIKTLCVCIIQATLVHWTKKIIVEEGHSMAQLVHMLWVCVIKATIQLECFVLMRVCNGLLYFPLTVYFLMCVCFIANF